MNIFPEDQVDENFFDLYYHPYKKQIWGVGLLFSIAVVGFLGVRQMRQQRLDDQWSRYEKAMELRTPSLPGQADPMQVSMQVDALEKLAAEFPDDAVAPFALNGVVQAHVAAGQLDAALGSLDTLQSRYPEFALNTLPAGAAEGTRSLAEHLRSTIESEKKWQASTAYTPKAPSESQTAIIDTNLGTLEIGFYPDDAPEHVAAFMARAKRGDYNGTQFYEVRLATDGQPQLVRGGSSASKAERDPAKHDRDDPADAIEPEDSRFTIRHDFGVIAAVDMDSGDESATSFQIVTAEGGMSRFDGQNTPFAAILDRPATLATLQKIGTATTYGTNPETATADGMFRMRDHPYPRVLIRRIAIVTDEKVDSDHDWDTSRVGTDEPEPWEAELAADPLPAEFAGPTGPEKDDAAPDPGEGDDAKDESEDSDDSE